MIKFLVKKIDSVTAAAFLVAVSSLLSRLLGLLRDRVLAGQFGAGHELDVYYAAFRVPDLVFNLLVLGALSAGFIPVFTGLIKDNQGKLSAEANRLISNLGNLLLLALSLVSLVGAIFAPQLMKLITPGFSADKIEATAMLARIMFLSPILLGFSSLMGGVLQSYKKFFVYSLSPIFYNLGIIVGAVYLAPRYGVIGLAYGVVVGALLHCLVQLSAVIGMGWRWQPLFDWRDRLIGGIFKMTVARTLGLASSQLNLLATTVIASTLAEGSLSIFNLANNLQSFPVGIFGISFAIAVFPVFSVDAFNRKKLVEHFSKTLRQVLFFMIPLTGLFIALRAQIVRAALGSGRFNWTDTTLTMDTLAMFAISFFAQAAIPLLTRMFYARHDSKTPFFVGLTADTLNIAGAWWLGHAIGVRGLALSFSITSVLNLMMLWLVLRSELKSLDEGRIVSSLLKMSAATLTALVFVQGAKSVMVRLVDLDKFVGIALHGAVSAVVGLAVYLLVVWILKSEEFYYFRDAISRRLNFKTAPDEDQGEVRGI